MNSEPITYPQDFIDRLIERTAAIQDAEKPQPRPEQAEALVRLLARAQRAGIRTSVPDAALLLDLIEGWLPPRLEPEPEIDRETR
jgi:hypothetical protein